MATSFGEKKIPSIKELEAMITKDLTIEQANAKCVEIKAKPTKSISSRITGYIHYHYKNKDLKGNDIDYLPITSVVEAGMIYFLKLSQEERVKFIATNSAKNVKISELNVEKETFCDYLENILLKKGITQTVLDKLSLDDKIQTVCNFLSM